MGRTITSRLCDCGLFALLLVFAPPVQASSPDDFIRTVSAKAFSSLAEANISDADRIDRFQHLLNESFDLAYIGRFVLGINGRRATDAEKAEFQTLFEKFLVRAYANRFRDLTGKKLNVIRAEDLTERDSLVITRIEITGNSPIPVNWKVRGKEGAFKIIDVTVEGISMSVTQRDEFAAVIRQNGGKVEGLIKALRRKTGD